METATSPGMHRFRLDLKRYQLLDGDQPVRLERQPFEALILLAERRGELVSRDEIASRLWADGVFVDTDRSINSIIRKLRQALGDDPDRPVFIETVVGKGYRFVGPIEITPQTTDIGQNATTISAGDTRRLHVRHTLGVAFVVAAIVIVASWLSFRGPLRKSAASPARSIAVLPLQNLSGDSTQDYFADGVTEELTSVLAQSSDLRVISHTSVARYKNTRTPVAEIAKELNVDAVIEGSVLRSGDRVRITAQLIRAPADQAIWSNTYERGLRDILILQRDITEDIAEQVKIKLAPKSRTTRALDPESHDLYLRGLSYLDINTEAALQTAISYFQKALARNPEYAEAYAGIADCYVTLGTFYVPPLQTMPQAKAAALKALELNPNLSDAHVALGSVYYLYEWDWSAAQREAETAIRLNPNDAYALDLLAGYYGTMGRAEDSMVQLKRARALDPNAAGVLGDTVFWAFMSRKYDLAISNGESVIAADPTNAFAEVFLGMAYAKKGNVELAIQHADAAVKHDDGLLIASFRANVYALAKRKMEAVAALKELEKQRVEHYSCAYELGSAYILLGQVDRGFQWMNNAYDARSNCIILLKVDPRLDSVRSDARYKTLLEKVGLTE